MEKKEGPTSEPGATDGPTPATDDTAAAAGTAGGGNAAKKAAAAKLTNAILDPKFEGSKKKLRHAKLYDAMRKTAKRRDLTNRKPQSQSSTLSKPSFEI